MLITYRMSEKFCFYDFLSHTIRLVGPCICKKQTKIYVIKIALVFYHAKSG